MRMLLTVLIRLLTGLSILVLSALFFLAVVLRYQATLLFHQHATLTETVFFLLPNVLFYLALGITFLLVNLPIRHTHPLKCLISSLLIGLFLMLDAALSGLLGQTGDGVNLYALYYFLGDFFAMPLGLYSFQLFFYFPIICLVALIFYQLWLAKKQQRYSRSISFFLSGVFLLISGFSFSSQWAHSYNGNLLSFAARTFVQLPTLKHFNSANKAEVKTADFANLKIQPNVVIIVLESTRKEAISFYNPELSRATPFYDALAKDSLVFTQAYAVVPHTTKSLVSINCGIAPYLNLPALESVYGVPAPCLADMLGQNNYQTKFIQSATQYFENRPKLVEQFGFESFISAEDLSSEGFARHHFGYEDSIFLEENQQWLASVQQPFYAMYLTLGPHWPYFPANKENVHNYLGKNKDTHLFGLHKPHNNYLNSVYQQDRFLEQLFEQFKQSGHYHNTVFIVLADHGESFGEHHHLQHNNNMYQEVLNIPMLIHIPFMSDFVGEESGLISQTDIIQIVSNLLKEKPVMHDINREAVYSACWYWRWCLARTDSQYKYVYNFADAKQELYDLIQDPLELSNIAEQHPAKVKQFREQTLDWYQQQLALYGQHFYPQNKSFHLYGSPGGTAGSTITDRR